MMNPRVLALAGVSLLVAACEDTVPYQLPGEIVYSVGESIQLPYPAGGYGEPHAINAGGWIVGETYSPEDGWQHAALWRDGTWEDLHRRPWDMSVARDINDRNDIVGLYELRRPDPGIDERHAFMLRAGTAYLLGEALVPPGEDGISSGATAVNERGNVVGFATQKDREDNHLYQAIIWHTASSPVTWTFIGTSDATHQSVATDINELYMATGRLDDHIDLNNPDPSDAFAVFYSSSAGAPTFTHGDGLCRRASFLQRLTDRIAINNDNWIVGSHEVSGVCRAVRFQSSSPPALLGGTSSTERSHAFDVNDLDVIVGVNAGRPVFWTPDGDMIDLPTLGFPNGEARGINNANEIVGVVYSTYGARVPVYWRVDATFVPDPGPTP